jgi:MFS family permease
LRTSGAYADASRLKDPIDEQHRGRKLTCLLFCAAYTATCVCALVPWFPVLFLGRCLGGLSTSILFSVFEAWLVSSSHALNLPSEELSAIFGTATLANGLVAAASGVFSNGLVHLTGHYGAPFAASALSLIAAASVISKTWGENFGGQGNPALSSVRPIGSLQRAWNVFVSGAQQIAHWNVC